MGDYIYIAQNFANGIKSLREGTFNIQEIAFADDPISAGKKYQEMRRHDDTGIFVAALDAREIPLFSNINVRNNRDIENLKKMMENQEIKIDKILRLRGYRYYNDFR